MIIIQFTIYITLYKGYIFFVKEKFRTSDAGVTSYILKVQVPLNLLICLILSPGHEFQIQQKAEASISRLCFSLSSYLYFLVTKKSLRLQVSDGPTDYRASAGCQPPTLTLLVFFLGTMATAIERAAEEKYVLLNKIKDINELARQEVDEIINTYVPQDCVSSSENIQKRRYIAMVAMCRIVGHRNRLIVLLLLLMQNMMNIVLAHFQDSAYVSDYCHSMKVIAHRAQLDAKEDLHMVCGNSIPVLERLEALREDLDFDQLVFRLQSSQKKNGRIKQDRTSKFLVD